MSGWVEVVDVFGGGESGGLMCLGGVEVEMLG